MHNHTHTNTTHITTHTTTYTTTHTQPTPNTQPHTLNHTHSTTHTHNNTHNHTHTYTLHTQHIHNTTTHTNIHNHTHSYHTKPYIQHTTTHTQPHIHNYTHLTTHTPHTHNHIHNPHHTHKTQPHTITTTHTDTHTTTHRTHRAHTHTSHTQHTTHTLAIKWHFPFFLLRFPTVRTQWYLLWLTHPVKCYVSQVSYSKNTEFSVQIDVWRYVFKCMHACICLYMCVCACVWLWGFHPVTSSTELVLQSLFISMVQVLMVDVVSFERERERAWCWPVCLNSVHVCLCFHVLSYSHTLLIEFKTYTMLCSLYTFLVYFNAFRNVLGCWLRDYAPEVTLVEERNTRWGSSFFSWLLKQSASMSKTVRSLYIFTLLKHCSRPYKSAIFLCLKVSCRSKYCSKISSQRHHKAQRALFVLEYGRDARASWWAEWRRTVNWPWSWFKVTGVQESKNFCANYLTKFW